MELHVRRAAAVITQTRQVPFVLMPEDTTLWKRVNEALEKKKNMFRLPSLLSFVFILQFMMLNTYYNHQWKHKHTQTQTNPIYIYIYIHSVVQVQTSQELTADFQTLRAQFA